MEAAFRALVVAGALLLIGAGVFGRWIGPESARRGLGAYILAGMWLGCACLVIGSLGEVALATVRIGRGSFAAAIFHDYLAGTRHGVAVQARVLLALAVAAWGIGRPFPRRIDVVGFVVLAVTLALSISFVSHSGALGLLPLVGDAIHLLAAAAWAGSLFFLAWLPLWHERKLLLASTLRISRLGVVTVAVLAITGVYMAALHMYGLEAVVRTAYGQALAVKVLVVLFVLAVAAANRFLLVPRALRAKEIEPLRRLVRIESLLLALVVVATGVLATREPATDHGPDAPHHHAFAQSADGEALVHHGIRQAGGPVELSPTAQGNLAVQVDAPEELLLSLRLIDPFGGVAPVTVRRASGEPEPFLAHGVAPHQEVIAMFQDPAPGPWRLVGEANEQGIDTPFTVLRQTTPSGTHVDLFLIPTPRVSEGGFTEMYVITRDETGPVTAAVHVAIQRQGERAGASEDRFEPVAGHAHHDQHLKHTTLLFEKTGLWDLRIFIADEVVQAELEVLE